MGRSNTAIGNGDRGGVGQGEGVVQRLDREAMSTGIKRSKEE